MSKCLCLSFSVDESGSAYLCTSAQWQVVHNSEMMGIKELNFTFALIWFDSSEFIIIISHFDARKFSFRAGFYEQMSHSELRLEVLPLSFINPFLCW